VGPVEQADSRVAAATTETARALRIMRRPPLARAQLHTLSDRKANLNGK